MRQHYQFRSISAGGLGRMHTLYLASEQMSGYVTEQMIEVNGGQYMPCQELRALLSDPGWLWVPDICAETARCATSCARPRTIRDPKSPWSREASGAGQP